MTVWCGRRSSRTLFSSLKSNFISYEMKKKITHNFYRYKCLWILCLWCCLAHFIHEYCESSVTNEQASEQVRQTVRQNEQNVHFFFSFILNWANYWDILNYINSENYAFELHSLLETFNFCFAHSGVSLQCRSYSTHFKFCFFCCGQKNTQINKRLTLHKCLDHIEASQNRLGKQFAC